MMILRPVSLDDVPALARLGRESFNAAFAHLYDPADLNGFLDQVYSDRAVEEEVRGSECIHRLAWDENVDKDGDGAKLLGFCKMREPSWYVDHSDASNPIALGQLYTDPTRTGEGIGAALMDWAIEEARARQKNAIQLSVWSENYGAQRFYARYGFVKIADIDFWVGNHRDDEFLYELRLDQMGE